MLAAARERNIAVVIGMAETDNGRFYNTTLLITPDATWTRTARLTAPRSWPAPRKNQAFALMVNRVEQGDGGLVFAGGSALVDPLGTLLFEAGREEGQFAVELDLNQLTAARQDYRYLDDQRLRLPGEIVEHACGLRELLIPGH